MRRGMVAILPLALGVATYGFAFGVLASEAAFSPFAIGTMGVVVFAGSSQIAAVDQFLSSGTVIGAALAGAALNLRYIGIAASMTPVLKELRWPTRLLALQYATDENFGLTLAERAKDPSVGGYFLLGSGLTIMVFWVTSTVAGALIGQAVPDLDRFGIGFAFTAAFIAMARAMWPGRQALIPWIATFAITIALVKLGLATAAALIIGAISGVAIDFLVNRDDP